MIQNNYIKQLDGLRFVAVTLVLIDHWTGDALNFPISYLGVCMFFVLSGFLITRILLQAKEKDEKFARGHGFSLKQFYIRRTIRIFPVYYLTIFILYLLNEPPIREKIAWYLTYSTNIYVALKHTWLGSSDHLWSLAVEEQFYLFFPFVVLFTPLRKLKTLFVVFIISAVALRFGFYYFKSPWMTPYVLMPTALDAFGLGALLAFGYFYKDEKVKQWITNRTFLLLSLMAYLMIVVIGKYFAEEENIVRMVFLRLFESIFSVFLVGNAAYGFGGLTKQILENRVSVYLGQISYGLYIYHKFVYDFYRESEQHPTIILLKKIPFIAENVILKLIFLYLLTIALASLSWKFFEKPINQLKDKFSY